MKKIFMLLAVLLLAAASTRHAEVFSHITAEHGVVEYSPHRPVAGAAGHASRRFC